jgi:hypothetical protein
MIFVESWVGWMRYTVGMDIGFLAGRELTFHGKIGLGFGIN